MNMDLPISPDCGMFPVTTSIPPSPYDNMRMNAIMQQSSPGMTFSHSQQYFTDLNMPVQNAGPMGLMDENSLQYFQEAQAPQFPQSVGISFDNRRMSQPDLRVQTQLRPHTPSHQIQTST
ncbi:hypothetical protein CLAIMM_07673 [Cladophialophora immunda]|nr:hypothetical protein CLAIMM_07673 [Cladophialophora immunda]